MLKTFDFADTDSTCAVRFSSILPTQALSLLNSKFVGDEAEHFARRLIDSAKTPAERAKLGIEIAFSRDAKKEEIESATRFMESFKKDFELDDRAALERFCLLLLNVNEFMFVD